MSEIYEPSSETTDEAWLTEEGLVAELTYVELNNLKASESSVQLLLRTLQRSKTPREDLKWIKLWLVLGDAPEFAG